MLGSSKLEGQIYPRIFAYHYYVLKELGTYLQDIVFGWALLFPMRRNRYQKNIHICSPHCSNIQAHIQFDKIDYYTKLATK